MEYQDFTTLRVDVVAGVARVTFDHGPINLMDMAMLADLDRDRAQWANELVELGDRPS